MNHCFDIADAEKYGVNPAIVLNLLRTWIAYNRSNAKNFHEGRTWTYNSVKSWAKLLPYLTPKQVRSAIDDLVAAGILIKGNFNENRHDQTCWYSLTEEAPPPCPAGQMRETEQATPVAPEGKRLDQSINQIDKPSTPAAPSEEGEKFIEWFMTLLRDTGAPINRLTPASRALWADTYDKLLRLDGKTKAEIAKACRWAREDSFWRTNFYSPVKLRERKDGVARIDQFLDRQKNPPNANTQKPNSRSFSNSNIAAYEELDRKMAAGNGSV